MKKIIIYALFLASLVSMTSALVVYVNIDEVLKGNLDYTKIPQTVKDTPLKILINWNNIGSVGCSVQARTDIYQGINLIYSAWSKEKEMEPGSHNSFEMYWYPKDKIGEFTAKTRVYYCNEIHKEKSVDFEVLKPAENYTENAAEILKFKINSYRDYIDIKIKSNKNLKNILIIPEEYPRGWTVEPGEIREIREGEVISVRLNYEASIWKETPITLGFITEDGKYYTKTILEVSEKPSVINRILFMIFF